VYLLDSHTLFFANGYRQLHLNLADEESPQTLTYQNRRHRRLGTLLSSAVEPEKREIKVPVEDLCSCRWSAVGYPRRV